MLALLLAALPFVAAPVENAPTIAPADAAKGIGELVIVQGKVDQVSVTGSQTTYLNVGGRHPNHVFTAVIFKSKQAEFSGAKGYEGKIAQVRGVAQLYRGKPEIILNEPGQLRSPD